MEKHIENPANIAVFVGGDDGHDTTKLAIFDPADATKRVRYCSVPAKATMGANLLGLDGVMSANSYVVDNLTYTVSSAVTGDVIDTRSQGSQYPTSPLNLVFVHDALISAGLGGRPVKLVSGLPVRDYYFNGRTNVDLLEAKKINLAREDITPLSPAVKLATITQQQVACEALAAIYDMAFNDDGSDNEQFYEDAKIGPIGVVDLGGKTLDLCVAVYENGGLRLDMPRGSSYDVGTIEMTELIAEGLRSKLGQGFIAPNVLHRAMTTGIIYVSGQKTDISDIVERAVAAMAPKYLSALNLRWGRGADLSKVIVVGGGAYKMFEIIQGVYSQAERPADPEFANARGMLKLARSMMA